MSTTIIAIKGQMGNTEYYLITMKVQELVKLAHVPEESTWKNMTVEERYQRELNEPRVRNQIVPYFRNEKDRFIGSIILASENADWNNEERFEPLTKFHANEIPKAYKGLSDNIGYFTFEGNEQLLVLDGQHRVMALKMALEQIAKEGGSADGNGLINDDISVILIGSDRKKSRKVFTKINTHAKSLSPGQTLITNDDDIVAIIAREVANKLIGAKLVSISRTNLSKKDNYFIPLTTIADGTASILSNGDYPFNASKDRKKLPEENKAKRYTKYAMQQWEYLLNNFKKWNEALLDKSASADEYRAELREDYLCNNPVLMKSIIEIFSKITNKLEPLSKDEAIKRLNALPWSRKHNLWVHLLVAGRKIINKNEKVATALLLYIVNDFKTIHEADKKKLENDYRELFPEDMKEKINLDGWLRELLNPKNN